jgi:phenylacetate-CoA ligase
MTAAHNGPEERNGGTGIAPLTAFATETWGFLHHSTDLWLASLAGPDVVFARGAHRLNSLVTHARRQSRFYADLYRDLPPGRVPLAQLPPVEKSQLMARFNDWVTQPELRLENVLEFASDPHRIGKPYLSQYAVWTSSGTTGSPGVFVHDPRSLAVYEALFAVRTGVDARAMLRAVSGGSRFAFAAAIDGHFSGITMWKRMRMMNPWMSRHTFAVSVLQPMQTVCDQLAGFAPEILTSYASELVALAEEQRAGRLGLQLKGIWSGGETLTPRDRANIAGAFGCPVVDDYGASEFLNIAYDCGCGVLHLNRDWVILEAVDRDGRPVADGTASHTALLTNLANFVQPIIRYDLGDSITFLPEPCPCGSPLPALRVEGRRDDTLCLSRPDGLVERIVPLALCTAIEERTGIYRFQVIEESTNQLALRIDPREGPCPEVGARVAQCVRDYCAELGVRELGVRIDPLPPQGSPVSGKLRRVCIAAPTHLAA